VRRQSGSAWLSKLASGSTRNARFIHGAEHGDARFATASMSHQHADALQKASGYRLANKSTYGSEQDLTVMALDFSDGSIPIEANTRGA
jgi:hypothetical protein